VRKVFTGERFELTGRFMKNLTSFFDFFLPRFCVCCKEVLDTTEFIVCHPCLFKIERPSEERLVYEFERKFSRAEIVRGFAAPFIFEKDRELQQLIHGLKYDGKFLIGIHLGKIIGRELQTIIDEWMIDYIVPVPLHHLKRAERGFNQSDFISKGIKSFLNIPIKYNLLKRTRFTETQTNLTLVERAANMNGAFRAVKSKDISGKNILLVDDVITTGATISECGKVLLESGAAKIYAVSAAIAD
jgi:ComF family protein